MTSAPLSLYADLLDPDEDDQNQDAVDTSSVQKPAILHFQRIKRPTVPLKSSKPKANISKLPGAASTPPLESTTKGPAVPLADTPVTPAISAQDPSSTQPTSIPANADETKPPDSGFDFDDDNDYDDEPKRRRGGRKAQRKRWRQAQQRRDLETDWADVYDPTQPTNLREYIASEERVTELYEWKRFLHRRTTTTATTPPRSHHSDEESDDAMDVDDDEQPTRGLGSVAAATKGEVVTDEDGDAAYQRRVALSQATQQPPPPPPSHTPRPQQGPPTKTLSFGHRAMTNLGWKQGTGLGASSDGILTPLRFKIEKTKPSPTTIPPTSASSTPTASSSSSSGRQQPAPPPVARIVGGKLASTSSSSSTPTTVVLLRHMLDNMADVEGEIEGGLGQEIGEECGDRYGRVERVYFDLPRRQVFVQFTDTISALKAVTELKGRDFNGNAISPSYFDVDKFEQGIYE